MLMHIVTITVVAILNYHHFVSAFAPPQALSSTTTAITTRRSVDFSSNPLLSSGIRTSSYPKSNLRSFAVNNLNMFEHLSTFPGYSGIAITAVQIFLTATMFGQEANPKTRTPYSKFSSAKEDSSTSTWPSRVAMMVIYTPSFIVSMALLALGFCGVSALGPVSLPAPSLALLFIVIHFGKRCFEVMLLHKYSGRTDRDTPTVIGTYYTLVSILIAFCGVSDNNDVSNITETSIGAVLFAVGIAGNLYHHYLLAKLRGTESKQYVAPRGGLFEYVATPHYLFELVGWLGIAIVSKHINSYLVFASMASYLAGRSVAQNEFNRAKFEDWPSDRKNLIPFIF